LASFLSIGRLGDASIFKGRRRQRAGVCVDLSVRYDNSIEIRSGSASLDTSGRIQKVSLRRAALKSGLRASVHCLILACAVSPVVSQDARQAPAANAIYKQRDVPVEQRLDDLLGRMSLDEKVRQLDLYAGAKSMMDKQSDDTHAALDAVFEPRKAEALLGDLGVGGIHDLYPTPVQSNAIQRWIIAHNRLAIPAMFIEEGLHGYDTGTVFPAPIGLSATWDPGIARETGAAIAAEARAAGVDMILAPVLDLARDPRWGRVEEDFGEDTYLTGQMGLAFVRGAQGDGLSSVHTVVAEPKHFVAHGSPEGGTNTSPVHMGERELRMVMLRGFEPAIRQGHAMAVMGAYHEIDGIPITADPFLLKHVLRNEWGFQGFVLSDLGAIRRLYDVHHVAATPEAAVCTAIRSGVDMQFYDFDHDVFQKALIDCIHNGMLSEVDLDRAVRSVLRVKFDLGLFDNPLVDPALSARANRSPEHLAVSLKSARESMTLLKNDGNILPLSHSVRSVAVIGPNGDVARYGDYEKEENGLHISIVEGIRKLLPQATVIFNDGADFLSAVSTAKTVDVVILALGERQGISGEGSDRSNLDLPGKQEQLLEAVTAAGKPEVLVLENGRPLTIGWAKDHVPAILEAWYPGEFGGQAVAETLFGDNNPAGRLTVTFPRSTGQLPEFYNSDPSRVHKYVDDKGEPLFPFGYGLSYTRFSYDHVTVQPPSASSGADITVTVDVTNTGTREGDEVVQLYMREDTTSVETPSRSLEGFSRIHLKPGETQTVAFHVPQQQLAVWNAEGEWAVESGKCTVWVGGSSLASLSTDFTLTP
jgi:beta-glucosidase